MTQVSLVPILLVVAALAARALPSGAGRVRSRATSSSTGCCATCCVFPLGLQGLWAFVGHVFFPAQSAAAIGWADSPFQFEVGMANLGIGLASLYAAFRGFEARLAASLAAAAFLMGAGVIHIKDIVTTGNFAPGNAGPILVTDFLTPIAVLVLLYLSSNEPRPKSPATARARGRARSGAQGHARISQRLERARQASRSVPAKTSVVPSFLTSSTS